MFRQTMGALFLVGVILACGACRQTSAKSHIIPDGFEICETMLSGDEGPNGFEYLKQVDVGNTGEQEDEWEDDEPVETSTFELDRHYTPQDGFGFVGAQGEAAVDPGWSLSAWPYGGDGDAAIYLSGREGFGGYRFDVQDGVYSVTFHFIEKAEHWSGFRKADLIMEGETVFSDYDIFEEVGNRFMVTAKAVAVVEDGHLDIELRTLGTKGPPILSGLEVEAVDPDDAAPFEVTDLVARGGYEQAILSWRNSPDDYLRGVNVWRREQKTEPWTRVNPRVVAVRHFVDHSAESGKSYFYEVTSEDLFCNESKGVEIGPVTILNSSKSSLRVFELAMSQEAIIAMTKDVSSDTYVPATLTIDGQAYAVEARNRGASTRYLSKPNFKIRLKNNVQYQGRNGFKLNSEVVDETMIREKLAYDMFNESDSLAPIASYIHLSWAGRYMGVYTEIQEVDKLFFVDNGISDEGNLYRMGTGMLNVLSSDGQYEETYEKKTNESDPAGYSDIIDLTEDLSGTAEHLFAGWFDQQFASDEYIDFLAVNALVANYDMIDGNQYMYHDTSLDKWHHIPWDYNNGTLTDTSLPLTTMTVYSSGMENPWWFNSITRVMTNTDLRTRLLARIEALISGVLSSEKIVELCNAAVQSAVVDVALDPWMVAWERDQSFVNDVVPAVEDFASQRTAFLSGEIAAMQSIHGPLVINEFQLHNTGQITDEYGEADPWIELYNRGNAPVGLAGICLTADLRDIEGAHCFGDMMEIGPGQVLVLFADGEPDQSDLHLSFTLSSQGGEMGLYSQGEGEGDGKGENSAVHDLVFYAVQNNGESYGRTSNGAEQWGSMAVPTPGS